MRIYKGETFAEVYQNALRDVLKNPEYVTSPRNLKIKEVTNATLIIEDPKFSLYENERRSSQFKYIGGELIWYFSGRNDIDFISKFAKFWEHIDNGDGTVNSAYGNLIFREKNEHGINQYQWALESLINDKDSRQAILHFNKPQHQRKNNKDFVCTLTGVFQIRDNKLNFTIDMRSNDLILGTPTDVAFFCLLQEQMCHHLKDYYPELEMGTYTHIVHSLHIYEKHFQLIKDMLKHSFEPMSLPDIEENIIDEFGNPLPFIRSLEEAVLKDSPTLFKSDDALHSWIHESIFADI
jgi:thymidylate synthase